MATQLAASASENTVPSLDPGIEYLTIASDEDLNFPENTATKFTNSLYNTFEAESCAEIHIKSLWSNWSPQPFVVKELGYYINAKLVFAAQCISTDGQSPYLLPPKTLPDPAYQYFPENADNYATVTFKINLYEGYSMNDQHKVFSYISSAVRQVWLENASTIFRLFVVGSFLEFTYSYLALGPTFPPESHIWNKTANFINNPIGQLVGLPDGNYGLISYSLLNSGTICRGIPGAFTYDRNLALAPTQGFATFGIILLLDLLTEEGFNSGPAYSDNTYIGVYVKPNYKAIKIARIIGLPHDFIAPFSYFDVAVNAHCWLPEMSQLLNFYTNPTPDIIGVNIQNTPTNCYLAQSISSTYPRGVIIPFSLFQTAPCNRNISFLTMWIGFLCRNTLPRKDFILTDNTYKSNNYILPRIKLLQNNINTFNTLNGPLNGVICPDYILYPKTYVQSYQPPQMACMYPQCLFYDNYSSQFTLNPNMILRRNIPDYLLENDRLFIRTVANSNPGGIDYAGQTKNCAGIMLTLILNNFGLVQQTTISSNALTFKTGDDVIPYRNYITFADSIPYGWTFANFQDLGTTEYPAQNINNVSTSNFMPMVYQPATLSQTFFSAYIPRDIKDRISISFEIINELNEDCNPETVNGKKPFTCLTIEMRRYSPLNNQVSASYFGSQIGFKRRKGQNYASAVYM